MNKELFVSDFKRLSRLYPAEELPGKIADYVRENFAYKGRIKKTTEVPKEAEVIIQAVTTYFKTSFKELGKKQRYVKVVYPRKVCMYLLYTQTRMTLEEIGKLFHKDHTSVMHCRNNIADLMITDPTILAEVELIKSKL